MLKNLLSKFQSDSRTCKICSGRAASCGYVDFSKSCLEEQGIVLPTVGVPVPYWRCGKCGFLFTDYCDAWTDKDFKTRIYNEDYAKVDPDFTEARAQTNADNLLNLLGGRQKGLSLLDYGGGDGKLAKLLAQKGIAAASFDPFFGNAARPTQKFDIVTCYEVMEHSVSPQTALRDMVSFLKPEGIILFSTLVITPAVKKLGPRWWYVAPRNGHVSIYTKKALDFLFGTAGFKVRSFNQNQHIAYIALPVFAEPWLPMTAP